jgi:hypothetical protein
VDERPIHRAAQIKARAEKIETAMWPPDLDRLKPDLLVSPQLCAPACGWRGCT